MFWLPSKTIYTGPKRQRGNIVIDAGLPPQAFILPNGDFPDGTPSGSPGWSLIQRWDADQGDVPSIVTAFNSQGFGHGIAWNPAGTLLTLASAGNDTIRTFSCAQWNPATAVLISTRSVTNPQQLSWNSGGTVLFSRDFVGDYIEAKPGSAYIVGTGAALSSITKGDMGAGGSTDGFASFRQDGAYMISEQDGPVGGNTLRRASFTPPGNLDSFALGTAVASPATIGQISHSVLDNGEEFYYRCKGSQGVQIMRLPDNPDLSTASVTANDNTGITPFRPDFCWIDPNDTRYFWALWNTFGGRIARYDTGLT